MNRFRISTPEGTRDLLFSSCRALRQTENAVRDALEERGYSEIITPAVEYFDVFAQANPELDQDQMLKIIDKSGRICVARPDNTTPIARIAATRLDDAALPVRLYYSQKVFRSVSGDHGHKGEFLQVGAEFIGADGLEADKDILSAAFAALSKTGADNFRVELGHAEIYKALMDELGADAQSAEGIRRLIENKSFAALGDALEPFKGKPAAKALSAMPNLFGGIEVLDEVESLTGNVRVLGATAYLRRLYQALDEAGYGDRIMIDLGLVHEMDYYTGEVKEVFRKAYSTGLRAKVNCYGANDVTEGVAIMWKEGVDVSITGNSTNPTRFQHPVAGTYKKECIEKGKKYFSVASGGGTGRTLHPDNMAAGPASYGMTDTMGRMHSDAQFAGSSSVPAHVEMMGLIGMGNNPMVGATVACAVAVEEAMKA